MERLGAFLKRTDLHVGVILDEQAFDHQVWSKYMGRPEIDGLFYVEYLGYRDQIRKVRFINGKPLIHVKEVLWDGASPAELVEKINSAPRNPQHRSGYTSVLLHAWSNSVSVESVKRNVIDRLAGI